MRCLYYDEQLPADIRMRCLNMILFGVLPKGVTTPIIYAMISEMIGKDCSHHENDPSFVVTVSCGSIRRE